MSMLVRRSTEINANLADLSGTLPIMEQTNKLIAKIDTLLAYEKEELHFHKNLEIEYELTKLRHRLDVNRLIQLHINHMILIPNGTTFKMTIEEKKALNELMKAFESFGKDRSYHPDKPSLSLLKNSVKHLTEFDDNQMKSHYIYELLMINRLLNDHPNKKKQV